MVDIAWESTTVAYQQYVTDERYQKFSDEVKRWYKPYRCSHCEEIERLRNEVEYYKLEMEGVQNGKMDLAKLLGCEDEPRWKWLRLGVIKLRDRIAELERALKPFADAVYNDNGDITVNMSVNADDLINAYFLLRRSALASHVTTEREGE